MTTSEESAGHRAARHLSTADRWVFVTHTAAPGGGDLALARYLAGSSLTNLGLISMEDGPIWDAPKAAGIDVKILSRGIFGPVTTLLKLRRALTASGDTNVVANSMRAALLVALARPRRTRFVYWVRDGLTADGISLIGRLLTRVITLRLTDMCIANSGWTAETIRASHPDIPIAVLPSPSGIRIDPEKDDGLARRRSITDSPVRLIYLGRIAPWKGVHIAIEAVSILNSIESGKRYTLDIAGAVWFGEDEYLDRLREQASSREFVTFLGHNDDVPRLLQEYDGLVHCSVVPEPFGQVIVQGMSAGLAVFATKGGGPSEIISEGTDGFLVDPNDPDALSHIIHEAFSNGTLLSQVRDAAIKTGSMYSDVILIDRIDAALMEFSDRPA